MSPGSPAGPPSGVILIVEDHPLVAKFFQLALERVGGFSCLVTEDVPRILDQVHAGAIALAILDVTLKEARWEGQSINGVQLAALIRRHSSRRIPIILATAHASAPEREAWIAEAGADAYLEKPIYEADVLVDAVRRHLKT